MKMLKILALLIVGFSSAYATELCSTQPPRVCADVTKVANPTIPGSYYYTCSMTINNQVHQERLFGNCKDEATCATLESFYTAKLNAMQTLPIIAGKNCDTH